MSKIPRKIPDLENGPCSEECEPHSKTVAPNCVVEIDDLTGLFLASSQGAYYRDQHLHQQIHIAGSPRGAPYYYDKYHRQYHMRFPPKPRAYRQYYQGRHANNENRRYFQREPLERSILSNQNDRRRRKTERRTSEDARSREKHILIIQDKIKAKGKIPDTRSPNHQLPDSGSNNSNEPRPIGSTSEDNLSNSQASQSDEERNESQNQRAKAIRVGGELSATRSSGSDDSMNSISRSSRHRDRRAEDNSPADFSSDEGSVVDVNSPSSWRAPSHSPRKRAYRQTRSGRVHPQMPYSSYFPHPPPMPYYQHIPRYHYHPPFPPMPDYIPPPPPPQMVPPARIPSPRPTQIPDIPQTSYTAPPHIPEEIQAKEKQKALNSSKLSDLQFHDRLTAAGIHAVYYRSPPEEPLSYNIALNSLQRMVLHELQGKLVGVVRKIVQKQGVEQDLMEDARELLGKYTTVNRDYDYMTEKLAQTADNGEKDPFLISTKDILGFCLMRDHQLIPTGDQLKEPEQVMHGKRPVVLPGSSRNEHEENIQWARLWERILMGVCGGVALIAPMLLMVLHKTQATTLATTSVATIFFALMLALLGKNLRGQDVLAAVAAYAAVLVVFVGASST